jgi:hypothetical protein
VELSATTGPGNGYGDGNGDGNGYGNGYGDGSGNGYGNGYGDGNGYGNGYGDGSGNGYGNGYGDGYGSGNGYGYGDGYWNAILLSYKAPAGTRLALWWSDREGQSSNGGGRIAPAAVGVVHEALGPLALCRAGTLHATLMPEKWRGRRLWVVAMHGEVIGDEEKFGCLKREIIAEVSRSRAKEE